MGFEYDYNPSGTVTQVNRYILGARGIDRVARTESGNTTLAYPMYDGHGNMRALLTRNGTSYSTGNWKTYDVWGSVRSGGSSGDPKQGYVASIGHVSDSESSLIYMRARYHEPATGRFLSEDSVMDGFNWHAYCHNDPLNLIDTSGNEARSPFVLAVEGLSFAIALNLTMVAWGLSVGGEHDAAILCLKAASAAAALALSASHFDQTAKVAIGIMRFMITDAVIGGVIAVLYSGLEAAKRKSMIATMAVIGNVAYLTMVIGALLFSLQVEE